LRAALRAVVVQAGQPNGGLDNNMWATVVNRDGVVCAVVFSGEDRAGIFSGLALSTANLYWPVQPGESLFGLQHSNPVDATAAYRGNSANYGLPNDAMVGDKIGGVNVFGGGVGLYDTTGQLIGGLGVSGDTSCTDHVVAWKVRHLINLDSVPTGLAPGGTDNMIQDIALNVTNHLESASGFGHPTCPNNPSPALLQAACPTGAAVAVPGCAAAVVVVVP
jgi:hypothetical protein